MLRKLFTIPDTFDPDDRRRRQVLSIILITIVGSGFFVVSLMAFQSLWYGSSFFSDQDFVDLSLPTTISIIVCGILLAVNRSKRTPGWLTGTILISLLIVAITLSDTPAQLYNGRSTLLWAVPIVIAALVLPPRTTFLVTLIVCGMMQAFTPPSGYPSNSINYYSMIVLTMVAFFAWLGMTIASRAIHDARNQAANLQAIYDHVADGVLVLDLRGKFLSANPALLAMIPQESLEQIITEPLSDSIEWKHRVFSIHASPVPEIGTVAVFRDETRRHETERARDALLATASHELRTPLAATMNYIELLSMLVKLDKVDSAEFKQHLARALENCKRLQQLVDNILDQAQIQAGALQLKREPFDLRALLEKARQLLDVFITQKKLSYELSIDPQVPLKIQGDAERLQQVLVNLIGNAVKFTDHGGVQVRVSAQADEQLSIQVADTGAGIPPEQLPDIFEPFRRGSNYAQRERQGAGLGLSIVKEIVERMGGQISAASEPGHGSTFTVTFPIQTA